MEVSPWSVLASWCPLLGPHSFLHLRATAESGPGGKGFHLGTGMGRFGEGARRGSGRGGEREGEEGAEEGKCFHAQTLHFNNDTAKCLSSGSHNKNHRLGDLNNRHSFFTIQSAGISKAGSSMVCSAESSLPTCRQQPYPLSSHCRREGQTALVSLPLL